MKKSKKKQEFKQLDISAALRGEDVIFEAPIKQEVFSEIKKLTPFDICNDIRWYKSGELLNREDGKQAFVPFMIFKILSMDHSICEMLNTLQPYINVLSKEQLYNMLIVLIPKKNREKEFFPYIKNKEEEAGLDISLVAKYFQCSIQEAKEYSLIMGQEWTKLFTQKCGDFKYE